MAAEIAPALEELSTVEEIFEHVLDRHDPVGLLGRPARAGPAQELQAGEKEVRRARLLAESAQERVQRAMRISPDPTLKSLLLAARLFDYLGMKSLYAVEWADYFRQLKENPNKELVPLYIGNQMNSTTYGMLTDLREMISELREQYREAWLEEATPFRLQSALYRWDAEADFWLATWHRVNELLRSRGKDNPSPPSNTSALKGSAGSGWSLHASSATPLRKMCVKCSCRATLQHLW